MNRMTHIKHELAKFNASTKCLSETNQFERDFQVWFEEKDMDKVPGMNEDIKYLMYLMSESWLAGIDNVRPSEWEGYDD